MSETSNAIKLLKICQTNLTRELYIIATLPHAYETTQRDAVDICMKLNAVEKGLKHLKKIEDAEIKWGGGY
jgi:hypothetical protein